MRCRFQKRAAALTTQCAPQWKRPVSASKAADARECYQSRSALQSRPANGWGVSLPVQVKQPFQGVEQAVRGAVSGFLTEGFQWRMEELVHDAGEALLDIVQVGFVEV
jgi:hypothetical protein